MSLVLTERFTVHAPAEQVWRYLIDPRQVVTCLPGAELTEVEDERTFRGRVTVKVGPVTVRYLGRARLTELDEQRQRVRVEGDAQEGGEGGGSGSARMVMTSEVTALDAGTAEVRVDASVDVTGKLVQFGRGMIQDVSRQLFRQFASCVRTTFEARSVSPSSVAPPLAAAGVDRPAKADAPASDPDVSASETRAVRILPIVFGAVGRAILRLFRRGEGDAVR